MKRNKTLSLAILSGLAVIASVPAWSFFVGYAWNGTTGPWNDPNRWSPNAVPNGAGNSATIGAVGTYTVSLDTNRSIDSVTISGTGATLSLGGNTLTLLQSPGLSNSGTILSSSGGIVGELTNNASGNINLSAGQSLNIASNGLVTNNGNFNINNNAGGATTVLNFSTPTMIFGSGRIQMSQAGTWAQLNSNPSVTVTNGAGHTIGGRGQINAMMVNGGMIHADWTSADLVLRDQTKNNNGTMKASLGNLVIDGITVIQSISGQILGDNGAVYVRNGASLNGGTLNSTGTGQIISDQGSISLVGVTNQGAFNLTAGRTVSILPGGLTNNGLINVNSNAAGANTTMNFTENTTISGTGTIQMSQSGSWAQLLSDAGKVVTNSSGHTIKGRGQIGAEMINQGTIHADWGAGTLMLFGGAKTNAGMMKASGGSPVLSIDGCAVTQTGAGQVFADNANIGLRNNGSISGGVLNSLGASNGFFCDSGDFNLANLTTNGNLNIAAGRTVNVGAGLFANNGLLSINYNATGSITGLNFNETTAITGNGTIQMSQAGTWAQLTAPAGKVVTNSAAHTIKGRGQISAELVNNGNIIADWSSNTLVLNGGAKTNNLMMKAASNGVLSIDGCTVNQGANGKIFAEAGNVGIRNDAVVSGGTLDSAPSFGIYADSGNARIQALTNAGMLNVQHGRTLEIGPGALVNNGTINLNYTLGGSTTIMNFLENVTISGSGTVQMSQAGSWADIATAPGKTITNANGHTFKGRGRISGSFVNNGLVSADWGSETLELMGSPKTNNATMKAAGSNAVLSVRDCVINQSASGRIWAEASNVGIRGTAVINGGRLESQPTFGHYIDSGAPTLNGVTNLGLVNISHGNNVIVGANGLTNNGSMNLNYTLGGSQTKIQVPASATIGGTGTIQMSQTTTWAEVEVGANQTLTNDVGHTIKGRGLISGSVLNKGNIFADWGSNALNITPAAPGSTNQGTIGITNSASSLILNAANLFTNQGAVNVIAGSGMTVNGGDYSQTDGTTTIDGTLTVTGGNKVNMTGGILKGSGVVNAPVLNTGTGNVEPGNSAGKLRVQGTYNQPATGTLTIELGGTTPVTQHDVLEVTGAATLAGKLKLRLINAFVPSPGQVFTILTAGSVSGNFIEKIAIENGNVEMEAVAFVNGNTVQVAFMTKVTPTSFAVTGGLHFGGVLSSLFNSDNDRLFVLCDSDDSIGVIEVTTTSPIPTVGKLRFAYEGSAVRTDLTEIVSFWSYTANNWQAQDPIMQSTLVEKRTVLVAGANAQQFVKPGPLEMKAQIMWLPNADLVAFDGWSMRADQLVWYVAP